MKHIFTEKSKFQRKKQLLKGYKNLKKIKGIKSIEFLKSELIQAKPPITKSEFPKKIFGNTYKFGNDALRQFLFKHLGGISLTTTILESLALGEKPIVYPMPKYYRSIFKKNNWKISEKKCEFEWNKYLLLNILKSLALFLKFLFINIKPHKKFKKKDKKYAYFIGLNLAEYFPDKQNKNKYNVCNWFYLNTKIRQQIKLLAHDNKEIPNLNIKSLRVEYRPLFKPLESIKDNFLFSSKGLRAIIYAFFDLINCKWASSFLLPEIIKKIYFELQKSDAVEYFFHNGQAARPLWSYCEAEKGNHSKFYFFSTNTDSFKTKNGYDITPSFYQKMDWDGYFVWNKEQKAFLNRCGISKSKIQIVGPIWSYDSASPLPKIPKRSIAVFDVPPRQRSIFVTLGLVNEYYTVKTNLKFLNDIREVARKLGFQIIWKGKRNIINSSFLPKSYLGLMQRLKNKKEFLWIDPRVSAHKVIKKAQITISMPFTSTSLIADHYKKRTFFYDPLNYIQKNDRAASGIAVLSGKKELYEALK